MTVLTFLPRFAPLVKAGTKCRTIRGQRKRPIKAGDKLSLRMWSARPYGSPQVVLREAVCSRACSITIGKDSVQIGDDWIGDTFGLHVFAERDGFADWPDMVAHFTKARGLPFRGVLIEWSV